MVVGFFFPPSVEGSGTFLTVTQTRMSLPSPSAIVLRVLSYEAPGTEYLSVARKGGKRKNDDNSDDAVETGRVQVCVKNKAWDIKLGSEGSGADFRKARISTLLLLQESDEVVSSRTCEAVVFSVKPAKDGRTADVEVRISVLSSQFEGSLFKLRFALGEAASADSEPIKVVSKKSQLEKADNKPKRSRTTQLATRDAVLDMIGKMETQTSQTERQMARMEAAMQASMQRLEAQVSQLARGEGRVKVKEEEEEDTSGGAASAGITAEQAERAFRAAATAYAALAQAERTQLVAKLPPSLLIQDLASAFAPPPPPLSDVFRAGINTSLTGAFFDL